MSRTVASHDPAWHVGCGAAFGAKQGRGSSVTLGDQSAMWNSILSFSRSSLLYSVAQAHERESRAIPFTPDEMYRLQFIVPVALLALWFDNVEQERLSGEPKEKMLMLAWGLLSARADFSVPVGKMLVLETEQKVAKRELRVGLFSNIASHVASEEAIARSVMKHRMETLLAIMRRGRDCDDTSVFWSRERLDEMRREALSHVSIVMATGVPEAADDEEKELFLWDVIVEAQRFYFEHAIPAFKAE